jgi:DinB family protein
VAGPTREDALATLEEGWGRVSELAGRVPDDEAVRRGTIGGGEWSAKDLLGHLATWEAFALDALSEWRQERRPYIDEILVRGDRAIDELNEATVKDKLDLGLVEIRRGAEGTHSALVQAIRETSDEQWSAKAFYRTERRNRLNLLLGSILGAPQRPFGHAFAHLPDLEAFVSSLR